MLHVECRDNQESALGCLVRQYEVFRSQGEAVTQPFIPRPDISLIFHFGALPRVLDEPPITLPCCFACPIIRRAISLQFVGDMDSFVVNCKPAALSRILGLDLTHTSQRGIDLPSTLFTPLWHNLAAIKTIEGRIDCFSSFMLSLLPSGYRPDAVELLCNSIVEHGIDTLLKDLMPLCGASKSTLLRKFEARTGVNPKTLVRIVRFDYLWSKITKEHAVDYQDLVFDGNYFDQAHFINDFKAITGESPSFFLTRDLDSIKFFSGRRAGLLD